MTKLEIATTVLGGFTVLFALYNAYLDWQSERGMKKYLGSILLLLVLAVGALVYYMTRQEPDCDCGDTTTPATQTDAAKPKRAKQNAPTWTRYTATAKDSKARTGAGGVMAAVYSA